MAMVEQVYLMIDRNGIVRNACVWDGESPYSPPLDLQLVPLAEGEYYEFGKPRGIARPAPPEELVPTPTNEEYKDDPSNG